MIIPGSSIGTSASARNRRRGEGRRGHPDHENSGPKHGMALEKDQKLRLVARICALKRCGNPGTAVVLPYLKEAGQHLAGFAFHHVGEGRSVQRRLRTHVDGARAALPRQWTKFAAGYTEPDVPTTTISDAFAISRSMCSISSGISPKKTICGRNRPHRDSGLLRPDCDKWCDLRPAGVRTRARSAPWRVRRACARAAPNRPLMQVVHILGTEKEAVAETRLQPRKRDVPRIGLSLQTCCAPRCIKRPHACRIPLPSSGVHTSSTLYPARDHLQHERWQTTFCTDTAPVIRKPIHRRDGNTCHFPAPFALRLEQTLPVVLRASRSECACAASAIG